MKIIKAYNNNCVSVDDNGEIFILTGKGIGYQKRKGDKVDTEKIEHEFRIVDHKQNHFDHILEKIPQQYFQTTRYIVERISSDLDIIFNDSVHIALTDHIYYAVQRAKDNFNLPNILANDMEVLYPELHQAAKWAKEFIELEHNVTLPTDEIVYLTIHFANASDVTNKKTAQVVMTFVKDVLKIVEKHTNLLEVQDSRHYSRLVSHLKYLADRIIQNKQEDLVSEGVNPLIEVRLKQFEDCLNEISEFTKKQYNYTLSPQEEKYIGIHLAQLVKIK